MSDVLAFLKRTGQTGIFDLIVRAHRQIGVDILNE